MNGIKDTAEDKSIKYLYDENTNESVMTSNKAVPDPGTVKEEDKPVQSTSNSPMNKPIVENMTSEKLYR